MKAPGSMLLLWLGAPLIWAIHFLTVYASESLFCSRGGEAEGHLMLILVATITAAGAVLALILFSTRRTPGAISASEVHVGMARSAAVMGVLSFVAICWTALPALLLQSCLN